jgi:prophage regulatory protein
MQAKTIVRLPSVERASGLSKSSIYALIAAGKFPRPVKLGKRASGWLESDIAAWQAARIAERDAGKQRR